MIGKQASGKVAMMAAVTLGLAGGCVPVEKYNAQRMINETQKAGLVNAESDAAAAKARATALEESIKRMQANGSDSNGRVNSLETQLQMKQSELDELNRKYADAVAQAGTAGALPVPLTNELSQFAQQNPDVIEFDQSKGIVKFKSDVTFDVGDATLKPAAKETLAKFATILNSPAASGYELLVAGHTDSTPVNNPATIARGHKNNWYLSAHRAISVAEALMKDNVKSARLGVVGYADQRPVSSSGTEKGKAANRRVEVLILPTQARAMSPDAQMSGATTKPAASNNKDSGEAAPTMPPPAMDNK